MGLTGSSADDRMEQVMTALDEGLEGLELDDDAADYIRRGCLPPIRGAVGGGLAG